MRRATAFVLALLATAPAFAQETEAAPRLRITELLPIPDGAAGQREFVEIANEGATAVDLAGWRIQDAPTATNATNRYTFASLLLHPGQRVVLWSNGSADALGPAWSASATRWNDAGDAATLLEPDGSLHDWFGYGNTNQAPPPGFAANRAGAPGRGSSLQWNGTAWTVAAPTPGMRLGEQGAVLAVTVDNVPPQVELAAPATVRTRAPFTVRLNASDGNGVADLRSWSLHSGASRVANGTGPPPATLAVEAPARAGPLLLLATVTDAAGAAANRSVTVQVRAPSLAVDLPGGGALRFPSLRPGARDVESPDRFTVRNDGTEAATPMLDISPFRGPGASIPVDGNLWIGIENATGMAWLPYLGPLEPLPALQPGDSLRVALRLQSVPMPLPAGPYGTTFTVVAA